MSENPTNESIRIILIDDHPVVRLGLSLILSNIRDIEVAGQAENGQDGLALYRRERPDIALVDLRLNDTAARSRQEHAPLRPAHTDSQAGPQTPLNGIGVIEAIRAEFPEAKTIVLTTYDRDEDIYRSMRAGAMAYLVKDTPAEEIVQTIRGVARGQRYVPPRIAERLAERLAMPELSDRERQVLNLLVAGRSNKELAEELSISLGTVKYHLNNILLKLDAADRTQAVVAALRKGLAELS
jgi:two-component system NarL family response regulator